MRGPPQDVAVALREEWAPVFAALLAGADDMAPLEGHVVADSGFGLWECQKEELMLMQFWLKLFLVAVWAPGLAHHSGPDVHNGRSCDGRIHHR